MGAFSSIILLVYVAATVLSISEGSERIHSLIRQPVAGTVSAESDPAGFSCLSWRFGVETKNIRDLPTVPKVCQHYLADYMLGDQFLQDSKVVTEEAFKYAKTVKLAGDGKDIWILDVDDSLITHVDFYAQNGFGTEIFDVTALINYLAQGISPALPESLKLYRRLLRLGFKIVLLTGRMEPSRNLTESNLKNVGYHSWEKLILRETGEWNDTTQRAHKSAERRKLVESGYRIIGNMGDQWCDLLGDYPGHRTFKLPNPVFYTE